MRVLFLPSWYPPDGGWFFRDQALGLLRRGHEVSVLCAKPYATRDIIKAPRVALKRDPAVSTEDGLTVYRSRFIVPPRLAMLHPVLYSSACAHAFRTYIDAQGIPDLIHAQSSVWAGYAAYRMWRRYRIPYVVSEHRGRFTLVTDEYAQLIRWWFPAYLNPAFRHSAGVQLVGSNLLRGLGRYRCNEAHWEVISHGVDTEVFTPAARVPDGSFHFIFVGGLVFRKGEDLLLSAFQRMHARYPEIRLTIVGDGPERAALETFCHSNGLSDVVAFAGHLDREGVRNALQSAGAFVLPTRNEAQPNACLEAMSCGLPVITTEAVPVELVPDFAGVRVPVDDADALEAAMTHVYRHCETIDRHRIRQFVVSEHDRSVVTDRLVRFYETVLAGH